MMPSASGLHLPSDLPDEVRRAAADPQRVVGRYVLIEELGRGGMGVVWRAWDVSLKRAVAMKTLLETGTASDEARWHRFRREAQAAARLHHPGIVAVHEVGEHLGHPFIVMELVEGPDLETKLRGEPMPPLRVAALVAAIARALEHAHAEGIVHRDVKPENVIVDRDGEPHLTDFGLARQVEGASRLTRTGQVLGTPSYMAPEQAGFGDGKIVPATDVYALGGLLYRALVGRPPFEGENAVNLVRQVLFDEPQAPDAIREGLHPDLSTIALRCLEKEADRRYRSAGALADELDRFCAGEAIEARPIGRVSRVQRWVRRNRVLAGVVSMGAIVTLGLVVFALGQIIAGARLAAGRDEAVRSASARAIEGERAAAVGAARDAAKRAARAFADVGTLPPAAARDDALRRRRSDLVLATGLEALAAARRLVHVAPDDEEAARLAFDAAMALGTSALEAEQWSLAASAFEKAGDLGIDDAAAAAQRARVETLRDEARRAATRSVEQILEAARTGALNREASGADDAVFTLVGDGSPETVAILARGLDEMTARLNEVTAEVYRAVAEPLEDEATAGAKRIEGVDDAVAALAALGPGTELPAPHRKTIAALDRRIGARRSRGIAAMFGDGPTGAQDSKVGIMFVPATQQLADGKVSTVDNIGRLRTDARLVIAEAQSKRLRRELGMARLCCRALGRIGVRRTAVEALGRYLRAERDPVRAADAAIALLLIGGKKARRHLAAAKERFGEDELAARLEEFLERTGRGGP